MTIQDKKKAQILVLLLIVAGATWLLLYRSNVAAPNPSAAKGEKKGVKINVAPKGATILPYPDDNADDEVGRKNIFQYQQKAAPPAAAVVPPALPSAPPPMRGPTANVIPPGPPPPPPFKAFRYEGYSVVNGKRIAAITEGTNAYQVTEGECLMGQYCIKRLTEAMVEIEDRQMKRTQPFPRIQP